jgi:hypothetical protein
MTKKYTVESSTIVRKILGWPPGSEIPVLMLTKTITANIMASESEVQAERGIPKDGGEIYQRPGIVTYRLARSEETW